MGVWEGNSGRILHAFIIHKPEQHQDETILKAFFIPCFSESSALEDMREEKLT